MMQSKSYTPLGLLLLLSACLGCSDGITTIPVSGRITLDGGEWPRQGILYFACKQPAEGFPRRTGVADFGPDGSFTVTSFDKGDGLVPGEYVVNIECWEVPPSMGAGPPAKSAVPKKYQTGATSGFTLTVPVGAGRMDDVKFDVPAN